MTSVMSSGAARAACISRTLSTVLALGITLRPRTATAFELATRAALAPPRAASATSAASRDSTGPIMFTRTHVSSKRRAAVLIATPTSLAGTATHGPAGRTVVSLRLGGAVI